MSGNQASLPLAGSHLQVRAARPAAAPGSASCCPHTADSRRRPRASSGRCTPRRSTTTRRSRSSRPARRSPAGRAWARGSATASAATTQNLPAFVVLITQGQGRPAALRAAVGQRLPAVAAPGRAVPQRQGSGALPRQSRRRHRREPPARCSTGCASCNSMQRERHGDPEIDARIAQYEMAYRMQTSVPGGDRRLAASRHAPSTCTARTRARPARSPPTACWPGGWPSAACGSSSSITRAGTSTATCRATSQRQCRGDRPAPARRWSPT